MGVVDRFAVNATQQRPGTPTAADFWDEMFAKGRANPYSRVEMPDLDDPVLRRALEHFGDVNGKTLVDLGCGRGATSLFFAHCGARVISVDLSRVAIDNLASYCRDNGVRNITTVQMSAMDLDELGEVDFVFGSMILHHIEPFAEFAVHLRTALRPGGKGFFWENNARSRLMIWCRDHLVGRFWIPKFGDTDEFPLTLDEIDELHKHFEVEVEYPELLLFRMIPFYLFRSHLVWPFGVLDRICYRYPTIRQHGYRQYICLR